MKRILHLCCLLAVWFSPAVNAQSGLESSESTSYSIAERGPNHRVWQKTTYETGPDGQRIPVVRGYTELATGMHYKDASGQWVESKEEISILPNGAGAVATNGQHKAIFPPDLYDGQIELNTPDGKWLRSQVLGLSYLDTASGKSVLIAEVKNSTGQLASSNIVIYPNAFTDFAADVRYTYTRAGFEQDIILRQQPPSPSVYGFNPDTTHLQVLTEFISPPAPKKHISSLKGIQDESLDFGAMKIGRGKAFALEDKPTNRVGSVRDSAPVGKQWLKLEGRDFLVEEVAFKKIEPELRELEPAPATVNWNSSSPASVLHRVVVGRALPNPHLVTQGTNRFQIAKSDVGFRPGYVLDYQLLNGATNLTFRGDTTYYVDGDVDLYGATVIEGGTVVKFAQKELYIHGTIECRTGPYRMAVFTSKDDDSVGDTISGSSGNPAPSNNTRYFVDTEDYSLEVPWQFDYIAFRYSGNCAVLAYDRNLYFRNCQFVRCHTCTYGRNLTLKNVLFYYSGENMWAVEFDEALLAEHITVDHGQSLSHGGTEMVVLNSIFRGLMYCRDEQGDFDGGNNGFADMYESWGSNQVVIATDPFQTVGAGYSYLTNDCGFHNAGTTNITSDLLADLRKKTTYAPVLLSNVTVSADTILSPQAQRDTDVPDLGYHYDPIDYWCHVYTVTNATLTLTNGAVVAYDNTGAGICLRASSIASVGTPLAPNWIVHYATAQEQPVSIGYTNLASVKAVYFDTSNQYSKGQYRFTFFSVPAGGIYQLYQTTASGYGYSNLLVLDCQIWGGLNYLVGPLSSKAILKNNLFWRSALSMKASAPQVFCAVSNNLMYGSPQVLIDRSPLTIFNINTFVFNNVFDTCSITNSGCSTNGYNAYINCGTNHVGPVMGGDITLSSFTYDKGPLGDFYQNSTNLIDAGSVAAGVAGLYHYTTRTNLTSKETMSIVDIGFHYVAVDTNGIPIDSDGDGTPDYLEDANGNGSVDSGESDWQNYNSQNGLSAGSGLQVFTPLK